jgi:hypothetical protein
MRKGMAIGSALLMVLMAFMVMGPISVADDAGVPTITVANIPDCVELGKAFSIVIIVDNPHCHDLLLKEILPPAFGQYGVNPPPLEQIIPPGHSRTVFYVIVDSVEAEDHDETNRVEIYDDGCLIASAERTFCVKAFDGFTKTACIIGDPWIDLNEDVHWLFEIKVRNTHPWSSGTDGMYDVVVTDRLGAEIEIDDPKYVPTYISPGTSVTWEKKGNYKITWEIGYLGPDEEVKLVLEVSTRCKGKKQAYTSPDTYEFNSGATLKFDRYFPCTYYVQVSAHTEQLIFDVPGEWPYGVCPVCE